MGEYKMSKKRKTSLKNLSLEFIAGLFFFLALSILAIFTILLSKKQFFSSKHEKIVVFDEVTGLNKGDKVLTRGVNVGYVQSVLLMKDKVKVELTLNQPVTIYKGYKITVASSSMLGGRYIKIDPGTDKNHELPNSFEFKGICPPDLIDAATDLVETTKTGVNSIKQKIENEKLIEKITKMSEDFGIIAEQIKNGNGTIGKLVNDEKLYNELITGIKNLNRSSNSIQKAADNINSLVTDVRNGKGTLGKLVTDDSLYTDLTTIITNLKNGKGTLGKLVTDDSLYTDLTAIIKNLKNGKGTLGKLLNDEQMHQEVIKLITTLQKTADALADGNSTISKLITDQGELYTYLNNTLKNSKEISDKINKGNGTLGKLITDDELYNNMNKIIAEIKSAVEDFREQAPISTFGGLIFGAL